MVANIDKGGFGRGDKPNVIKPFDRERVIDPRHQPLKDANRTFDHPVLGNFPRGNQPPAQRHIQPVPCARPGQFNR